MFVAGSIFNFRFLSEIRGWNGIYDMVIKRIWHFNHTHHTHHIIPWLGTVYGYIQNRCPSCKSLISCFLPCQGSPCTKMTSEDPQQRPGQTTQQSSQRARQRSSYLQAGHVGNLGPTLCPGTYGGGDWEGGCVWWQLVVLESAARRRDGRDRGDPWRVVSMRAMWAADMVTLGHWQNDQSQTNQH